MFSSLFGRSSSGGGRGKKPSSPHADSDQLASSPLPPSTETLAAVIATQRKRRQACARQAAKAEHRRDSFLHKAETCVHVVDASALNEKAAQAENARKAKTAMVITLQAQIDVLERVAAEAGMSVLGLDEDLDAADARVQREEENLRVDQEDVRVQQENAEEMSLLLSRGIELPHEEEDSDAAIRGQIDGFQQGVV